MNQSSYVKLWTNCTAYLALLDKDLDVPVIVPGDHHVAAEDVALFQEVGGVPGFAGTPRRLPAPLHGLEDQLGHRGEQRARDGRVVSSVI